MLVGLPIDIYHDPLLQCLAVQERASLRPLCKCAAQLFDVVYTPRIFISLVKPSRFGGRLMPADSNSLSYSTTPMGSADLVIAFDVPIDYANEHQGCLFLRLQTMLPGPRHLWKGNGAIVGLCLKRPFGTHFEVVGALQACAANGSLKYFYMTDPRLLQHLPDVVFKGCQLEVFHFVGPSIPNLLGKLELFKTLPRTVCFHGTCNRFLAWITQREEHQAVKTITTIGDFILLPQGLFPGHVLQAAGSCVSKLGICITTGQGKCAFSWNAANIAKNIQESFPNIRAIGVNLEVSCVCDPEHQEAIIELLRILTRAGIKILTFDVFLVQLRGGMKIRSTRLKALHDRLRSCAGLTIMKKPRFRTNKEIPSHGFALPASVALTAPDVVAEEVKAAIWHSSW